MPKLPNHFGRLPKIAEKANRKKKKPPFIAVVVEGRCTGCQVCIEFCPVDCIQEGEVRPGVPMPPVAIRLDECIGCLHCARACEQLTWNAIEMWETPEVEATFGVTLHESFEDFEGWAVPYTYTGLSDGTETVGSVADPRPEQWPAANIPEAPVKKPKPPKKPKPAKQ
jgi:NAD-dependent dihydropyrimidine dehydrogenase PreA subunit